jgi:hypothetical protein
MNNFTHTRIRTLYFKSSGDGKIDGSLLDNGFVINRSLLKKKEEIQYIIIIKLSLYHQEYFSKFEPFVFVVQMNNDFQYLK